MELENSIHIKEIKNCPNANEAGTKQLYRCVSKPISNNSFKPYGLSPKHKDKCEAWGLSVYNNIDSARNRLKSLSKNLANNYNAVAVATISDDDGIKYQSLSQENHYTFFPKEKLDLTKKFLLVTENDK